MTVGRVVGRGELMDYAMVVRGHIGRSEQVTRDFDYGRDFDEDSKLARYYRLYRADLERAVQLAKELAELLERLATRVDKLGVPS